MSQIKIYSTSWCAYCKAEMKFLDEHKVKYEHVDVEADESQAKEMIDLTHQMGVPVTRITHDDGTVAVQVGFDQDWLTSQLKLT